MKVLLIAGTDQHAEQFKQYYEKREDTVILVESREAGRSLIDGGDIFDIVSIGGGEIPFETVRESSLYREPQTERRTLELDPGERRNRRRFGTR